MIAKILYILHAGASMFAILISCAIVTAICAVVAYLRQRYIIRKEGAYYTVFVDSIWEMFATISVACVLMTATIILSMLLSDLL
jgi:uncharacterized membrane protein YidH (DUF202 family)